MLKSPVTKGSPQKAPVMMKYLSCMAPSWFRDIEKLCNKINDFKNNWIRYDSCCNGNSLLWQVPTFPGLLHGHWDNWLCLCQRDNVAEHSWMNNTLQIAHITDTKLVIIKMHNASMLMMWCQRCCTRRINRHYITFIVYYQYTECCWFGLTTAQN